MSKLAVEINTTIRKMMRLGQKGVMHVEVNKNGDVTSMEWKRSCYCLSRGLVPEQSLCPEHERPITQDSRRSTLEHLIDG